MKREINPVTLPQPHAVRSSTMLNIPDYILWKQDNPEPISRTLLSLVSEYRHKPRDDPDCCPRSTTAPLSPLDGQPVYTVTITERLSPYYSEMRRNEVYKARLYTQDTRDSSEHVEVVCKVARKEKYVLRLHVEAELYTTSLLNLQGRVVPRFYGLFEGTMGDDEGSVCVMILQYCGPSLSTPFGCFGIPFRYVRLSRISFTLGNAQSDLSHRKKIFEVMAEIHKAGVVHGDFRERNFLCDSERHIWVINFALAYPHSDECTSIPTDVTFYGKNESASTIACWEILEIGAELGIWYLGKHLSSASIF